ncbi:MAG: DNA helicase, partial [Prevotella sp.]|nr:DNA helicase [Prevotella sp.]
MLSPDELFDSLVALSSALPADKQQLVATSVNRQLHELLVLVCHEGTRQSKQAFGNLFSQVDYLCRRHHVKVADRIAIQTMRRHSNRSEQLSAEDFRYDLRALALFISAVFDVPIPHRVVVSIPPTNRPHSQSEAIDYRYIRCVVRSWDENTITASTEQTDEDTITIDYTTEHLRYLRNVLQEGMQLNLLDCSAGLKPALVVVEPDYMLDISSIAACFEPFGHHPLSYLMRRMMPSAISQPILLGNLAGQILDDTINNQPDVNASIRKNFRRKALDFSTCQGFSAATFVRDARVQAQNIREAVDVLFSDSDGRTDPPELAKAILEPSFVCERLGIQGRVDLMTTDFRLLVEQKSGKNFRIERHLPDEHGSLMLENHYVQLLLYYGVLRQNFSLSFDTVDMRLLYSRFLAKDGVVVVNYLQQLFREAIQLRNLIVAWELHIARNGFESVIDLFQPDIFVTNPSGQSFFNAWKRPVVESFCSTLHGLSPLERSYFCRMTTFVFRELRVSRLGAQEGVTSAASDLWNMPLSEKLETGNILMGLTITDMAKSADDG